MLIDMFMCSKIHVLINICLCLRMCCVDKYLFIYKCIDKTLHIDKTMCLTTQFSLKKTGSQYWSILNTLVLRSRFVREQTSVYRINSV